LEACERFKNEGNEQFKNKNYERADFEYQKALLQLDYTFPDLPEDDKKMEDLKEALYGNMATLKYLLKNYDDSIHHAEMALKINPKNVKARYRRCLCLFEITKFDDAAKELSLALEIDPKNESLLQFQDKLKARIHEYKSKEKNVYKSMFS
jgi:tetratricopeptide (TPR) repeat protein